MEKHITILHYLDIGTVNGIDYRTGEVSAVPREGDSVVLQNDKGINQQFVVTNTIWFVGKKATEVQVRVRSPRCVFWEER